MSTAPPNPARSRSAKKPKRLDAQALASKQREISVSEFFAKNRHLLGFDNPRKALLTTIKEAVDNALDACEESGILPDIFVGIEPLAETRFRVTVRDNGPGIVKSQVANIFGKLLYGSKFHRLKMSRGQQGIGIAAAGMYALMTTGKPMVIHTKPAKSKPTHRITLAIDTQKNKADISDEIEVDYEHLDNTGTEVVLELEGRYNRGRQSVDEYLEQTAIGNPHAQVIYQPPTACRPAEEGNGAQPTSLYDDLQHAIQLAPTADATTTTPGGTVVHPRTVNQLPDEPREIKPHPKGIELGTLLRMLRQTGATQLGGFLQQEFCRVSQSKAAEICDAAEKQLGEGSLTPRTYCSRVGHPEAEALFKAIQGAKLMAPPTDCLSPIGVKQILAGLLKGVRAEFFTAVTRPPAVYRGNPFQIEVGLAFGGDLPKEELGRVIRFANRVPLLYQQGSCCGFKAVLDTNWRNYGLAQSRGAPPQGPIVVFVHVASVWVPFTSESKEAIADYDEIRKEIKLALSECGRKLNTYVRRRQRARREGERRNTFGRYIGEVVAAMHKIDPKLDPETLRERFEEVARRRTEMADVEFDEEGNPIPGTGNGNGKKKKDTVSALDRDESTVILADAAPADVLEEIDTARRSPKDEGEDEENEGLFA